MIVIIVLILSTFGKNSSSTYPMVELEKLNDTEKEQLLRIFYSDKVERLDKYLTEASQRYGFNGNVLVANNSEVILHQSYGYADFDSKVPLDNNTAFQLASVSKQFTAVSILILKERGLIDIDSDIRKYLPEIPYENITVKNLLQHTSGLPNYMWILENRWKSDKIPNNKDLIKLLSTEKMPVFFSPGRRHDYSNTGYAILASIVESVTGKKFGDFVEENIFTPLEMNNSFVYSGAYENNHSDKLKGYFRRGRRLKVYDQTIHDGIVGDKSVYSTTGDLFKWDQSLYNNTLISENSLKEAFTSGKIGKRRLFPYGYGFRLKYEDSKKVVYHKGLWEGFRTSLSRFVDDHNTVIVLNNTSCSSMHAITERIESIANEEIHMTPEFEIIRTAISFGYEYGIDQYHLLKESDPGIVLNHEFFDEAIESLTASNKTELVSILKKISLAI